MAAPQLTRRQLGRRLRNLREQSGKSASSVEEAEVMSTSKLYRLENGQSPKVAWLEVQELCRIYGASADLTRELIRMAKECLKAGWWEPFGSGVPQWFQLYLELEQIARKILAYEVSYVSGLLQTEATMRAILAANPRLDPEIIDRTVEARLKRQRSFYARHDSPELEIVMDEGALRRQVGGPEIHAEQMAHLRDAAQRGIARIWVMPYDVGAYPGQGQPYILLEFTNELDPSVIYAEAASGARYDESSEPSNTGASPAAAAKTKEPAWKPPPLASACTCATANLASRVSSSRSISPTTPRC